MTHKFNRMVMVESPYNHPNLGREACVRYAVWACYDALVNYGEVCFASHLFTTQLLPETKEARDIGLAARDALAHYCQAAVVRYTDIGETPGMYREVDGTRVCESRKLPADLLAKWQSGEWPESSVRLMVL